MKWRNSLLALVVLGGSLGFLMGGSLVVSAAQFGRPDGDVTNAGGWSPTPLWQELDEATPDDATTEVTSGNNPDTTATFEVSLSNVTDPQASTGHVVRFRAKAMGPKSATLEAFLLEGATQRASTGAQTLSDGTYTTFSYTLTGGEADSIVDYADLRLRFVPSVAGPGGATTIQVTWAELEVPDAPAACGALTVATSDAAGELWFNESVEPDGQPFTTQVNVSASFQDATTPALRVTNDGSGACDIALRLMSDPGTGRSMKFNVTSNAPWPDDAAREVPVHPSSVTVCAGVAPGGTCDIWLWVDYENALGDSQSLDLRVESV